MSAGRWHLGPPTRRRHRKQESPQFRRNTCVRCGSDNPSMSEEPQCRSCGAPLKPSRFTQGWSNHAWLDRNQE